jgi:hypothetical protein
MVTLEAVPPRNCEKPAPRAKFLSGENGIVKIAAALLLSATITFAFARLNPPTLDAFERYIAQTEERFTQDLHADHFLYVDSHPQQLAKVRAGEIAIEGRNHTDSGEKTKVPDGMIQDWLGMIFIPAATIPQVRAVLQDYENYKNIYKPDVIDSRLVKREGDEVDIFLRLYKKQILTVVLNTDYHVKYGTTAPNRMYIISHSMRVAEVKNPKRSYTEELSPGNDTGFLWKLNAYWRLEEREGGVYAECEAISLSRDVPFGLGHIIGGFLERFPRESMINTLRATRAAVEARQAPRTNSSR